MKPLPLAAWAMVRMLAATVRCRVTGFEQLQEFAASGRGLIIATWHGRTLLPINYCRGMGIWAITSLSRDGELQTGIVERFGYRTIRGSSGRGGMRAALTACKRLAEGGILSITPDGPKGPANEVQEGIVFLSKRTGCPIMPIGVGASPCKIMNAWDSYMLPYPFSKGAIVFGNPICLSDGVENPEEIIKLALNEVQRQAQEMAGERG
ncbi:MAG: lysophospholipid acyltransferase family protein [Armatimonadota bacterium]